MSVFFIAYVGMKDRRFINLVIATITTTLFAVLLYGIGQKYLGFPAYLTMNEEFAKGVPIQLSPLSRVPSTFAGHYDLAAYLVLIIPILISLIFGFRDRLVKLLLGGTILLGLVILYMTVSRVSVFVLLISVLIVLFFQKRRLIFVSLPIITIIVILSLTFSTSLLNRFGNTVKQVDVLIDAKTGEAIGEAQTVSPDHFGNKVIFQKYYQTSHDLTFGKIEKELANASPSAILRSSDLPPAVILLVRPNAPTGENLPQGTGYINLHLSPVIKKVGQFYYDSPAPSDSPQSAQALKLSGDFLVKKAAAYDLSFTTRFQGEWPRALTAFKTNILFGSGYSSISLAVDNDYLRMLGEIGLLGFASFLALFLTGGIYITKILPSVDSIIVKSFVIGYGAGVVGLALNGIFIDVFEASKVAYVLWLLTGVTFGMLNSYKTDSIDLFGSLSKIATSTYAIIVYIGLAAVVLFSPMIPNYFVGDDFTWLRWAAESDNFLKTVVQYFTESQGFFYRPMAKTYFFLMHSVFWLNQTAYHIVSITLHATVSMLVFLLAKRVFGETKISVLASFLFLILSGYSEAVFWISSTGFLFTTALALSSLLFFAQWEEKRKILYFYLSLLCLTLAPLFHELGIVTPLFIILYKYITDQSFNLNFLFKKFPYKLLFFPLIPYLVIRFLAGSHWFSGDYSYNLLKLPFNAAGNTIGYLLLSLLGSAYLPFYQMLREFLRDQILFAVIAASAGFCVLILLYRFMIHIIGKEDRKIIIFGLLFFVIALLPFLGLGNISSRYSYLTSIGVIFLFVFLMKKIYNQLQSSGKGIALLATGVVIVVFSLLHIMQLQQVHGDWRGAGEKVKNFLIAIDQSYTDTWTKEPMKFYFVNVPIRQGDAWIFPVGLEDVLWLSFRNASVSVYQLQSTEEALGLVSDPKTQKVFEFNDSGKVTERKKIILAQ